MAWFFDICIVSVIKLQNVMVQKSDLLEYNSNSCRYRVADQRFYVQGFFHMCKGDLDNEDKLNLSNILQLAAIYICSSFKASMGIIQEMRVKIFVGGRID